MLGNIDGSNIACVIEGHLERAKTHFDKGAEHDAKSREHYRESADEIIAAKKLDNKLSNRAVGQRLGISHTKVGALLKWRKSGAVRTTGPFSGDTGRKDRALRQSIRERPEIVVEEILRRPNIVKDLVRKAQALGIVPGGKQTQAQFKPPKEWEGPKGPAVLREGDVVGMGDLPTPFGPLANHALICGDATLGRVALVDAPPNRPRLLLTDPPYGIGYRDGAILNDDRADWREAWRNFPVDHGFIFFEANRADEVIAGLKSVGFEVRDRLVWVKHSTTGMHKHKGVRRRDELIYRVERSGFGDHWVKGNQLDSPLKYVLTNKERKEACGHLTPKPVALLVELIEAASEPGDVVIDPFAGSGSTLIACEITGRRCLAIEQEPHWCDVIVRRWQKFTGRQAFLGGSPRDRVPFDTLEPDPDGKRYQPRHAYRRHMDKRDGRVTVVRLDQ